MPTYDYKCSNCGDTFEILQSIKAEPLKNMLKMWKGNIAKTNKWRCRSNIQRKWILYNRL